MRYIDMSNFKDRTLDYYNENALERGARVRILTGNYLGITQPSALYLIKRKLGDRVDL
jgi:HKD family nuclease